MQNVQFGETANNAKAINQNDPIVRDAATILEATGVNPQETVDRANELITTLTEKSEKEAGFDSLAHLVEVVQDRFSARELAFLVALDLFKRAQIGKSTNKERGAKPVGDDELDRIIKGFFEHTKEHGKVPSFDEFMKNIVNQD